MDIEGGGKDGGSTGHTVLFKDINYTVPPCVTDRLRTLARKWSPVRRIVKPCKPTLEILVGAGGALLPGRLTCILGPSGSGKTSLLHILAERKKSGVKGELVGTGRSVVLVSQEVCLMAALTARETLSLAAELKLPRTTRVERDLTMQAVAKTLGIAHTLDTRVDNMSGGERKRLTVAQELITDPPVLLLDEPTSGLDSVSSTGVILALQAVARSGCVVACSLHQPASRLFALCDDVVVLSRGRTLYAGPREDLLGVLEGAGLSCPQYYNPADYLLEVAHGDHLGNLNALEDVSEKYVQGLFDKWRQVQPSTEIVLIEKSPITGREKSDDDSARLLLHAHEPSTRPPRASTPRQLYVLLRRAFTCVGRDAQLAPVRVIAHALVAVLLGALFTGCGDDAARVHTNASCLFFFLLFVFFANSMPTIQTFPLEASVVLQEHLNHWYSLYAYFFSKLAAELPLQIICPTMFVFPAWYMTNQPDELWRVGLMWLLCFLMTMIAQTFGLLAGAAFNIKMALFVVPAANIPMLMFSGFFIPYNEIPEYLQPISSFSYFRYAFDGAMQAAYGFDRRNLNCSKFYCHYKQPNKLLEDLGLVQDFYKDLRVLSIWLILLQASLYFVLLARVKLSCR